MHHALPWNNQMYLHFLHFEFLVSSFVQWVKCSMYCALPWNDQMYLHSFRKYLASTNHVTITMLRTRKTQWRGAKKQPPSTEIHSMAVNRLGIRIRFDSHAHSGGKEVERVQSNLTGTLWHPKESWHLMGFCITGSPCIQLRSVAFPEILLSSRSIWVGVGIWIWL